MDHQRVNTAHTQMSCGVMELSRINEDVEGVLYALASRLYHPSRGEPCAFFVASDIVDGEETNASRLMNEVQKRNFGFVVSVPGAENPKTGNIITVYTWGIDHTSFKTWYASERVKKLAKVGS